MMSTAHVTLMCLLVAELGTKSTDAFSAGVGPINLSLDAPEITCIPVTLPCTPPKSTTSLERAVVSVNTSSSCCGSGSGVTTVGGIFGTKCGHIKDKQACCYMINKPCTTGGCCTDSGAVCQYVTSPLVLNQIPVRLLKCCYPAGANGTCTQTQGQASNCCDGVVCKNGKCVAPPKKGGGEKCTSNAECESGNCTMNPMTKMMACKGLANGKTCKTVGQDPACESGTCSMTDAGTVCCIAEYEECMKNTDCCGKKADNVTCASYKMGSKANNQTVMSKACLKNNANGKPCQLRFQGLDCASGNCELDCTQLATEQTGKCRVKRVVSAICAVDFNCAGNATCVKVFPKAANAPSFKTCCHKMGGSCDENYDCCPAPDGKLVNCKDNKCTLPSKQIGEKCDPKEAYGQCAGFIGVCQGPEGNETCCRSSKYTDYPGCLKDSDCCQDDEPPVKCLCLAGSQQCVNKENYDKLNPKPPAQCPPDPMIPDTCNRNSFPCNGDYQCGPNSLCGTKKELGPIKFCCSKNESCASIDDCCDGYDCVIVKGQYKCLATDEERPCDINKNGTDCAQDFLKNCLLDCNQDASAQEGRCRPFRFATQTCATDSQCNRRDNDFLLSCQLGNPVATGVNFRKVCCIAANQTCQYGGQACCAIDGKIPSCTFDYDLHENVCKLSNKTLGDKCKRGTYGGDGECPDTTGCSGAQEGNETCCIKLDEKGCQSDADCCQTSDKKSKCVCLAGSQYCKAASLVDQLKAPKVKCEPDHEKQQTCRRYNDGCLTTAMCLTGLTCEGGYRKVCCTKDGPCGVDTDCCGEDNKCVLKDGQFKCSGSG